MQKLVDLVIKHGKDKDNLILHFLNKISEKAHYVDDIILDTNHAIQVYSNRSKIQDDLKLNPNYRVQGYTKLLSNLNGYKKEQVRITKVIFDHDIYYVFSDLDFLCFLGMLQGRVKSDKTENQVFSKSSYKIWNGYSGGVHKQGKQASKN